MNQPHGPRTCGESTTESAGKNPADAGGRKKFGEAERALARGSLKMMLEMRHPEMTKTHVRRRQSRPGANCGPFRMVSDDGQHRDGAKAVDVGPIRRNWLVFGAHARDERNPGSARAAAEREIAEGAAGVSAARGPIRKRDERTAVRCGQSTVTTFEVRRTP